jgi:Zn-dependent metalloprotease
MSKHDTNRRRPISCIVPPYIFEKMLESDDPAIRSSAVRSMQYTAQLLGVRIATAEMGAAASTVGDARRTIFDARNSFFLSDAVLARCEGGDESGDDSVNRLYDGLGRTREFLSEVFQRNSLDDRGGRLDGYVHVGVDYNNATFDGSVMRFGDGDGTRFTDFTKSLDVIAHELGHGVTQHTGEDLEYQGQTGALNESFSDVFGSLVKQWVKGQTVNEADWKIGQEVWTPGVQGDALRSMKEPGKAYVNHPLFGTDPQPGHMNKFVNTSSDNGGVHINSGIPNKAFYEAAMLIGGRAWEVTGQVWYQALKTSRFRSTFQEFADLTVKAAKDRFGAAVAKNVSLGWKAVGITVSGGVPVAAVSSALHGNGDSNDTILQSILGELSQIKRRLETLEKAPAKRAQR